MTKDYSTAHKQSTDNHRSTCSQRRSTIQPRIAHFQDHMIDVSATTLNNRAFFDVGALRQVNTHGMPNSAITVACAAARMRLMSTCPQWESTIVAIVSSTKSLVYLFYQRFYFVRRVVRSEGSAMTVNYCTAPVCSGVRDDAELDH